MGKSEYIFVGSSSEGKERAESVARALRDTTDGAIVRAWWHDSVFRSGETFIESLEREVDASTAAVLVFTPDDEAVSRSTDLIVPRDNVVFEYGMFVGAVGRKRVALVQLGNAKLPSDLDGVTVVRTDAIDVNYLRDDLREKLRPWWQEVGKARPKPMPHLNEQLRLLVPTLETLPAKQQIGFDRNAARLVQTAFLSALTDSQSVNSAFVRLAEYELKHSVSISACDATGPSGWVGPAAYRYIASQVREYLFANRRDERFEPYVHDWLFKALQTALERAQQRMPDQQSATRYDDGGAPPFCVGTPRLQYSRILLWTDEELLDPLAEQVITLHEAFRIPLFHLPTLENSDDKDVAYVVFEKRNGEASVLYGTREQQYDATRDKSFAERGNIPGIGSALRHYQGLLNRRDLMLARDARELLLAKEP